MTSKLEKQKQILSLLNSRLINNNGLETELLQMPESKPGDVKLPQNRLLNQIYHFHKSIIQNINAGLITIDLEGEITFVNRITAGLLGYEIEELLGKNLKNFFKSPEEGDEFLNICALPGKKIDNWESEFIHKARKSIVMGINSSYLEDVSNNFAGVVLLLRDLTEVHHLKNQVERMERLALLGELSAGIAHEIRNPLAGIKAATQLLEENFAREDAQYQIVSRIIRETDKANRLLKEFFKFARPTRPKPAFHDIGQMSDNVYLLLAPRFNTKKIRFQGKFSAKLPRVYVDETQIEQVILNLFLNAIDSMKDGGVLKVSAATKRINPIDGKGTNYSGFAQDLCYVLLEISDTGTGIAPGNLKKIFNPFYTTKADGLGLGLSICSRLMEENKGKIDAFSAEGQGTTFVLVLPTFVHR
jgi:PAS domain S-box-containing protein